MALELDRTRGRPEAAHEDAAVHPAHAVRDPRWPGAVMVILILVAVGWPLVTLAAGLVAYLIADRDQAAVLAGVGAACLLLRWTVGG